MFGWQDLWMNGKWQYVGIPSLWNQSPDAKLSIVSGINRQTETSLLLNCVWISRCQFFQIIGIWINEVLLCTYVAYCCEVTDVFYWCACEYFENALAFTSFRLHWKKCFCAS